MFRKICALVWLTVMLWGTTAWAEETGQTVRLGGGLTVRVDPSYAREKPEGERDRRPAASYVGEGLPGFQVAQWKKGEGETLRTVGEAEAARYDAVCTETEYNGIPAAYYETGDSLTFLTESGETFTRIVFALTGDDPKDQAAAVMNTLAVREETGIPLGDSSFRITLPEGFDQADYQVYQWEKEEGETLLMAGETEAAKYGVNCSETQINNIPLVRYEMPNYAAYIAEEDGGFVGIMFCLDEKTTLETVEEVMGSLRRQRDDALSPNRKPRQKKS